MCGFVFLATTRIDVTKFQEGFEKTAHRGPDNHQVLTYGDCLWGFHRLSIMDLSDNGNQPFVRDDYALMCNGEVYNYPELKTFLADAYDFHSESDCEVLIPLYQRVGLDVMVKMLDAEFAFVLYDGAEKKVMAARDPFGIRPLFYGHERKTGAIAFASEAKSLLVFCDDVQPFPPGFYYDGNEFVRYHDVGFSAQIVDGELSEITNTIREKLERAVVKRLQADAPIGYLLSGGLDSSLVCAIAQKHLDKPIKTFAIGMEKDPIDLKYAREVADHLGTEHTEVIMTKADVLDALEEVVYHLETWDITTVRASVGMYLVCKYIENIRI